MKINKGDFSLICSVIIVALMCIYFATHYLPVLIAQIAMLGVQVIGVTCWRD